MTLEKTKNTSVHEDRRLVEPTPEEEALIQQGIEDDPDNPELDDEFFRNAERGVPEAIRHILEPREKVKIDQDIVAHFKRKGDNWQELINLELRKIAGLD